MDMEFKSHYDNALEWAKLSNCKSLLTREAQEYIEAKELGFMNLASKVPYVTYLTFGEVSFNVYKIATPRSPFIEIVMFDDSEASYSNPLKQLYDMSRLVKPPILPDSVRPIYKFDVSGDITALPELKIFGRGCFISQIEEGYVGGMFKAAKLTVVADIFTITTERHAIDAAKTWEAYSNGRK